MNLSKWRDINQRIVQILCFWEFAFLNKVQDNKKRAAVHDAFTAQDRTQTSWLFSCVSDLFPLLGIKFSISSINISAAAEIKPFLVCR